MAGLFCFGFAKFYYFTHMGVNTLLASLHICRNYNNMKTIILSTLLIISTAQCYAQDRMSDSLALVEVYNDLGGDGWVESFSDWLTDVSMHEWEGVLVQDNRVTKLELKNAGAVGVFPLSVLELSELKTLEIKQADIDGVIPAELVQLTNLDRLVLDQCDLSGELPSIFDQFDRLRTLVLSRNELEGPLPDLSDQINLCYIDRNNFTGNIPNTWATKNVSALQIQDNDLTGDFSIVQDWPFLKSADFSGNAWDAATFPEWVDDLPNLERFSCKRCNLSGDLPATLDFSSSPKYRGMFISDNDLSGDISLLFTDDDSEQDLYLVARNNDFSGEFPAHKLNSGFAVDLYGNAYSSTTPFADIELSRFDIQFNRFNYSALDVLAPQIESDSLIGVIYRNQSATLSADTITVTEPQLVTLSAGDTHPSTSYQWRKGNSDIVGETNAEISIEVDGPEDAGQYWCRMTNVDFADLTLNRERVTINVDISTSTTQGIKEDLSVFPNPSTGLYTLVGLENPKNTHATVSGMDGSFVAYVAISQEGRIDLTSMPVGSYIISVFVEGLPKVTRVIKH